jgi:hypothetical protein
MDRTETLDALDDLMQTMTNLGNDDLAKVFHNLYLEIETLDFTNLVESQIDPTAVNRNDYMCGFCKLPMGKTHCFGCGRYDGAMTAADYAKFLVV